jgi:hypothetical protein
MSTIEEAGARASENCRTMTFGKPDDGTRRASKRHNNLILRRMGKREQQAELAGMLSESGLRQFCADQKFPHGQQKWFLPATEEFWVNRSPWHSPACFLQPAQQARIERIRLHRLGEVIIHPGCQATLAVLIENVGGQGQNRDG